MSVELVRLACERCGEPNRRMWVYDPRRGYHLRNSLNRHHYNGYDGEHRHQVRWLCTQCHTIEHPARHDRRAAALRGVETRRANEAALAGAVLASIGASTTGEDGT